MQIRSIAIFSLGDEISPLKSWLIRTYPDRDFTEADVIYNYHHSRARKTIKNVFGILTDRGRIFLTPILGTVQNNERHVCASLVLHNYFCQKSNAAYTPAGFVDSEFSDNYVKPDKWRVTIPNDEAYWLWKKRGDPIQWKSPFKCRMIQRTIFLLKVAKYPGRKHV